MSYSVYRGNNIVLDIDIKDEEGTALDVTGAQVSFLVESLIEKSVGDGIEVIDAAAGSIEVSLSGEDTNITPGLYRYELLVIDAEGNRWTGLFADLRILKSLSYQSLD